MKKNILLSLLLLFVLVGANTVSNWSNRMENKISKLQKENKDLKDRNEYFSKILENSKLDQSSDQLLKYKEYSEKLYSSYEKISKDYKSLWSQNESLKSEIKSLAELDNNKSKKIEEFLNLNKSLSLENKNLKSDYALFSLKVRQLESVVKKQGVAQINELVKIKTDLAQNKPVCPQPIVKVIRINPSKRIPASVPQKKTPIDRFN